jgi:Zn finger protein HypA/HybF involved in hydrogenase expression
MKDQMLFCMQCDEPFIYSAKEQMRHSQQGFDSPRRCPVCRQHKVRMTGGDSAPKGDRRALRRARRVEE